MGTTLPDHCHVHINVSAGAVYNTHNTIIITLLVAVSFAKQPSQLHHYVSAHCASGHYKHTSKPVLELAAASAASCLQAMWVGVRVRKLC